MKSYKPLVSFLGLSLLVFSSCGRDFRLGFGVKDANDFITREEEYWKGIDDFTHKLGAEMKSVDELFAFDDEEKKYVILWAMYRGEVAFLKACKRLYGGLGRRIAEHYQKDERFKKHLDDVMLLEENGNSPVDPEILYVLFKDNIDINLLGGDKYGPTHLAGMLCEAAVNGDLEAVKSILEYAKKLDGGNSNSIMREDVLGRRFLSSAFLHSVMPNAKKQILTAAIEAYGRSMELEIHMMIAEASDKFDGGDMLKKFLHACRLQDVMTEYYSGQSRLKKNERGEKKRLSSILVEFGLLDMAKKVYELEKNDFIAQWRAFEKFNIFESLGIFFEKRIDTIKGGKIEKLTASAEKFAEVCAFYSVLDGCKCHNAISKILAIRGMSPEQKRQCIRFLSAL